jgi:hypothetical protein
MRLDATIMEFPYFASNKFYQEFWGGLASLYNPGWEASNN